VGIASPASESPGFKPHSNKDSAMQTGNQKTLLSSIHSDAIPVQDFAVAVQGVSDFNLKDTRECKNAGSQYDDTDATPSGIQADSGTTDAMRTAGTA